MKYLKRNKLSEALQLIDLVELQLDIRENSRNNDSLKQMIEIHKAFHIQVLEFFKLAKTDSEKYQRLLDNTRNEYNELFIETSKEKMDNEFGVRINPFIRRISIYYFSIINNSFNSNEEEEYNYYYNSFLSLLKAVSNYNLVDSVRFNSIFEENQKIHEVISVYEYTDFLNLFDRNFLSLINDKKNLTPIQVYFSSNLLWRLKFELILSDEFHINLLQDTLDSFEFGLINLKPKHLKGIIDSISSELFMYEERRTFYENTLQQNRLAELPELTSLCLNIMSLEDYRIFKSKINENGLTKSVKKEFMVAALFFMKLILLKDTWINILANFIKNGHIKKVITLIFGRQPTNSSYKNGNLDFFPMESDRIVIFINNILHPNKSFGLRIMDQRNLVNERIKVLELLLYRNYYWRKLEGFGEPSFLIPSNDYDKVQFNKNLEKILQNSRNFVVKLDLQADFDIWLKSQKNEIVGIIESTVLNATIDPLIDEKFKQEVTSSFGHKNSLLNYFSKPFDADNKDSSESWRSFTNTENQNKKPFISAELQEIPSVNAIEALAQITVQNLLLKTDHYIYNQIRSKSEFRFMSIPELEETLMNISTPSKIINSNIHFGWELLSKSYDYKSMTFLTKNNLKVTIENYQNYFGNKFVIIINNINPDKMFENKAPELEFKLNDENPMEVQVNYSIELKPTESVNWKSEIIMIK